MKDIPKIKNILANKSWDIWPKIYCKESLASKETRKEVKRRCKKAKKKWEKKNGKKRTTTNNE